MTGDVEYIFQAADAVDRTPSFPYTDERFLGQLIEDLHASAKGCCEENDQMYVSGLLRLISRCKQAIGSVAFDSYVMEERRRQVEKWGCQLHKPAFWIVVLVEELAEHSAKFHRKDWKNARIELVETSAVALAALEAYYWNDSPSHPPFSGDGRYFVKGYDAEGSVHPGGGVE